MDLFPYESIPYHLFFVQRQNPVFERSQRFLRSDASLLRLAGLFISSDHALFCSCLLSEGSGWVTVKQIVSYMKNLR